MRERHRRDIARLRRSAEKASNLVDYSRNRGVGELWINREAEDLAGDPHRFGQPSRALADPAAVGRLQVHRDRVVDASADAGDTQVLTQLIAGAAADDVLVKDMRRIGAASRQP